MRTGNWQNTLNINFLSGYDDYPTDVYEVDANGAIIGAENVTLKVKPYFTFDWQTAYSFNKNLTLAFGIKNLFDEDPPYTNSGGTIYFQAGYDIGYADPRGRFVYGRVNYKFF